MKGKAPTPITPGATAPPKPAAGAGAEAEAVARLCPECGLCCNGVLFADVELRPGDRADRLAALGLSLHRKGRKTCFLQPCAAHDGRLCRIYDERPSRCRAFVCGLLQGVQQNDLTAPAALRVIRQARAQADEVRSLLQRLGQDDERLALTHRYQEVMRQPCDLAGDPELVELRGELMLAVSRLMHTLQTRFREAPLPPKI